MTVCVGWTAFSMVDARPRPWPKAREATTVRAAAQVQAARTGVPADYLLAHQEYSPSVAIRAGLPYLSRRRRRRRRAAPMSRITCRCSSQSRPCRAPRGAPLVPGRDVRFSRAFDERCPDALRPTRQAGNGATRWLERAAQAAGLLNYAGAIVYQHNGHVEEPRLAGARVRRTGKEQEKLV